MKHYIRYVLSILLLLPLVAPAFAGPVDAFRAGEVARSFFQNDPSVVRRMAPLHRVELFDAPLTKAGETEPAFHIYNREGGGFVIVAGDDACKPVLAYSFENNFRTGDAMPEGIRAWLGEFEDQVALLRAEGARPAADAWVSVMARTKAGDGYKPALKWETPIWNQTMPFNGLTPVRDGKHCVIGCVPLAMGMIMRFFGYPAKGEGTLAPYTYDVDGVAYSIEGFELGHPYEWDKIKFNYNEGYTDEEADAVARLVYDCGVAVQAKFAESTSASTSGMAGCAAEYFGFDPGAYFYRRDLTDDAAWLEMLKDELQSHPILYSASRDGGSHAFLVDGYDEQGRVSVNWGWGGSSNGYYALSAFTPSTNRQYIYKHGAVFGLVPKQGSGGSTREYLFFQSGTASSGTVYNGLTPSGTIKPGQSFTMQAGFLYNGGIFPFDGQYFIALTDRDGAVVERISSIKDIDPIKTGSGRGYSNIDCLMRSYPMEGERIRLLYRSSKWPEDVWKFPEYMSDVTAEILVTDDTGLAEMTSLSYNKTSGEVTVETKDRVEWTLKNASGADVKEGIVYDVTTLVIPADKLSQGTYYLTLQRGTDRFTITLKMGK